MKALTAKQQAFAIAVADVANPQSLTDAYKAVYSTNGMEPLTISKKASEEASKPAVAAEIERLKQAVKDEAVFKAVDVLREWATIATADPAELIHTRRHCCRHCYGWNFGYQWRDEAEFAQRCDEVIEHNETKRHRSSMRDLPSCDGGFGYTHLRPPVPECPECKGSGETVVHVADTLSLSPAGRKLFAGVKQTKDGIQILMRDQDAALTNIAKTLAMFVDRKEVSGPGGGPIATANASIVAELPIDEAARIYSKVMG